MKTLLFNGHVLRVYDSVDEMPIINFQKYNKYLMIDAGIGSDANSVDAHIIKIAKYIKAKDESKALQELQNMRQNIYMINSNISPKYLAFAALIYSIDGKQQEDLSDEGLKLALESINKVKHMSLISLLNWLKKKVSNELDVYFPGTFAVAKEKELYDRIKLRTEYQLRHILFDEDNAENIDKLDIAIACMFPPKNYDGSKSVEVEYDKQFEAACLLIAQKANLDAKKMTVLQFYNTLDLVQKQIDAEMKSLKKHKR